MQFENDGSCGTVTLAGSYATRLGEHDGSGVTLTPAGSCATRLGEHDDSGGSVKLAGSHATRLGEHDGSGGRSSGRAVRSIICLFLAPHLASYLPTYLCFSP